MRECAGAQEVSINNSAQTAEEKRRNFQRMKSLMINSESIETEVKRRQERWSHLGVDSPDSSQPKRENWGRIIFIHFLLPTSPFPHPHLPGLGLDDNDCCRIVHKPQKPGKGEKCNIDL